MTDNTKMREAFVQACKEYGPTISFSDFECGWDACMAWQAAQPVPVEVSDSPCAEADGCPTEKSVLQRFWREAQSVPVVGEPLFCVSNNGMSPKLFYFLHDAESFRYESQKSHDLSGSLAHFRIDYLYRKPTTSIPAAELATLREKAAQLEHELETERMRLVACGVIALSNTADSAINARDMLPEYWSASAQDCASAVDREMDYRSRLTVTERERDELRKDAERLPALEHTLRHLGRELAKLDKYRLCMSYNDSYFGEPVGTVKRVVVELRHCIDAAMQERQP